MTQPNVHEMPMTPRGGNWGILDVDADCANHVDGSEAGRDEHEPRFVGDARHTQRPEMQGRQ